MSMYAHGSKRARMRKLHVYLSLTRTSATVHFIINDGMQVKYIHTRRYINHVSIKLIRGIKPYT